MLSFIKGFGGSFHEVRRRETYDALNNPGRGWYRIYTYRLEEEAFEEPVRYLNETLALVLINIGAYRDRDLPGEALRRMEQILKSFEKLGLELILRICYDTEGKGMVREPSLFSQVKSHLGQIAPIIKEHKDGIFLCQGLLIGNWGEMHGSKFLQPDQLRELAEDFLSLSGGDVPLAFRKPVQYRLAYGQAEKKRKIGFFNDGMLGSDTHLGTFGPADQGRGAWQEPWGISHELSFLEPFCNEIPYGGEVVNPPKAMKAAEYVEALSKLRVSYLNCTHDAALLDAWKKELYEGRSLYDHVGERLGYRFLVRQVRVKEDRGSLGVSLEVVNEGFGCLCEDARVQILTGRSGEEVPDAALGYLDGSLKALSGKGSRLLKGSFSLEGRKEMGAAGPKRIYARILRSRDERVIRFAQEGREGFLLLGEQG